MPAGFCVVCSDQAEPFHFSASVSPSPELLSYKPVASHRLVLGHEMPSSLEKIAPLGPGTVFVVQAEPEPDAAKAVVDFDPNAWPTAVQSEAEVHATEKSSPAGSLGVFMVHDLPFQLSMTGTKELVVTDSPTATHEAADVQATPFRIEKAEPVGSDGSAADHAVPFHDSAKGLVVKPTW